MNTGLRVYIKLIPRRVENSTNKAVVVMYSRSFSGDLGIKYNRFGEMENPINPAKSMA
jgi:hypothetical protein